MTSLHKPDSPAIQNQLTSMHSSNGTTAPMLTKPAIALPWLVHLRWGYIICQILLIYLVILSFEIKAPLKLIGVILFFEILSNAALQLLNNQNRSISTAGIAALFFVDTVLLTGLLFATGGAMNPFTFLYLVHIVLGAIILPSKWAWGLSVWTGFCYLLLFIPVSVPETPFTIADPVAGNIACHVTPDLGLHLWGMWIAFTITVMFIVYFVGRIQGDLAKQQITEQALAQEKAHSEKLASLVTLAAGAVHELSTPLATIAVAAGEMEYDLRRTGTSDTLDDVALINSEVRHCKEILYEIAAGAGEHRGEEIRVFAVSDAADAILASFKKADRSRIIMHIETKQKELSMEFRALCRIVGSLIQNSLDADDSLSPVTVRWYDMDTSFLAVSVIDSGKGMSKETLAQATQSFFTTKESGLGLGLFLVNSMVKRFGGELTLYSKPGKGTEIVFTLEKNRIT